jgi:predicted TIM-barrel fold metal-dependent hydrolase
LTLGADRILFAVDDPHEPGDEAVKFMDALPICDSDKEKIYHLNAERLLLK